ncbi:hypothetical protein RJT34_23681 [Clitoria ternatea]|uniref:Zinc finger A20 and AN1 domain-containing stress-associated protein 4 n=1 Tax=Clitoria ternatea TaxID=43366 RepID=A0AAN9IGS8_CLITE
MLRLNSFSLLIISSSSLFPLPLLILILILIHNHFLFLNNSISYKPAFSDLPFKFSRNPNAPVIVFLFLPPFREFSDRFLSRIVVSSKERKPDNHRRSKSMAEEHRCETPEGHRLCANNCGFFGSPTTMNLCSKCYGDIRLKEQEEASTKSTIETALSSSSSVTQSIPTSSSSPPAVESVESPPPAAVVSVASSSVTVTPNRCATCRKRVGLTGFTCRCGVTFCGTHRYPEKHACGFDFKAVGREEIARANPLIKAEKLRRI